MIMGICNSRHTTAKKHIPGLEKNGMAHRTPKVCSKNNDVKNNFSFFLQDLGPSCS